MAKAVQLKKKQPKTVQKTLRLPRHIENALREEGARVDLSVPAAINQILEDWHAARLAETPALAK